MISAPIKDMRVLSLGQHAREEGENRTERDFELLCGLHFLCRL